LTDQVLIIEHSLTVRMDLLDTLQDAGIHATACADAREARAALAEHKFGLVMLDVHLPDADGSDLMTEIRRHTPDAAVILLCSDSDVRECVHGFARGADACIGKPYEPSVLIARTRELLQGRRAEAMGKTIVLISDSVALREQLSRTIKGESYRVLAAENASDGLRLAASALPHAIILDDELSGIDAATLLRRIRLDVALCRMPCLLVTATEGFGVEIDAIEAGADGIVRKSADQSTLLARLNGILQSERAKRDDQESTGRLQSKKKVLAVDDSETYLHEVADALSEDGYEVILARSGEEALELLSIDGVDCVLLDVMMPGMDGQQACRLVKSAPATRETPVIMLTAHEDQDAIIQGLNAGADDYVVKSSDFQVLRARVLAQVRRKQFEDENRYIRDQMRQRELEAAEARAARELAETRAALVDDLERKIGDRTKELTDANSKLMAEIAQREKAEAALVQAQKMEAVGHLTGGIAHDFNNLLTAVVGSLDLIRSTAEDTRVLWLADNAFKAADRGSKLTDQLLAFSRKQRLEARPLDVNSVITGMRELLNQSLGASFTLKIDLDASLGHALADLNQLELAILNLVINSRDAMPEGGIIALATGPADEPGYVQIDVSDTGFGMPADIVARAFDPFFTTKPPGKGTGLGLSQVYGVAKQLGGDVRIVSAVGKGTTVSIMLPISDGEAEVETTRATQIIRASNSETILIIEDDNEVRRMVSTFLADQGYRVLAANTGVGGLDSFREKNPDLLILDFSMPDMNGGDVARAVRRHRPDARILFMSGYADSAALEAAVSDASLIRKPFRPTELAAAVRNALDR
jgi:DNA-binding response OmpR family regulator